MSILSLKQGATEQKGVPQALASPTHAGLTAEELERLIQDRCLTFDIPSATGVSLCA